MSQIIDTIGNVRNRNMSELSNMRILVVDDTEANIDILVETLARRL